MSKKKKYPAQIKENEKEWYAKAVTDTRLWFDKARELLALTEKIERGIRNDLTYIRKDLESPKGLEIEDLIKRIQEEEKSDRWPFQSQGVYLSLVAFGIENLCKGHIIQKQRKEIEENIRRTGTLPEEVKTHKLVKLVKEKVGVNLDQQEETLLRNLEKAAVWSGRYPVPVEAYGEILKEDYEKVVYTKASSAEEYLDHINALVDKISEHIRENLELS